MKGGGPSSALVGVGGGGRQVLRGPSVGNMGEGGEEIMSVINLQQLEQQGKSIQQRCDCTLISHVHNVRRRSNSFVEFDLKEKAEPTEGNAPLEYLRADPKKSLRMTKLDAQTPRRSCPGDMNGCSAEQACT